MKEDPQVLIAAAKAALPAGAGVTVMLDQMALVFYGIPLSAVSAAATAALVPALLVDPEPLRDAVRRWMGAVLFSISLTAFVMNAFGLPRALSIGVASLLAMFARDLHSTLRGQVPPLLDGLRHRLLGSGKERP